VNKGATVVFKIDTRSRPVSVTARQG
jgi:hypothetical protein